jgi:hypothetical protein
MTSLAGDVLTPMTAQQRAEFEREGFLVVPGVLSESEVEFYAGALDRVYRARRAAGGVAPGGPMHLLSAVANCPEVIGLIDHPRAFSSAQCAASSWAGSAPASTARPGVTTFGVTTRTPLRCIPSCPSAASSTRPTCPCAGNRSRPAPTLGPFRGQGAAAQLVLAGRGQDQPE